MYTHMYVNTCNIIHNDMIVNNSYTVNKYTVTSSLYTLQVVAPPKSSTLAAVKLGATERERPEISTLQLSLSRADHGTDTVTRPRYPDNTFSGALELCSTSLMACEYGITTVISNVGRSVL